MSTNEKNINGQPLPPGIWYFSKITDTDRTGYLWIITLMVLIVPLGTCGIRFHVRWGSYKSDDWTLAAATVFSIFQHIVVIVGLKNGLGVSSMVLDRDSTLEVGRVVLIAEICFVLSHACSKVSTALFIRRLFNSGRYLNNVLCWGTIAITAAWGPISLLVLLVDCPVTHYLSPDTCPELYRRWQVVTALDLFSEVVLIATPSYLISIILIGLRPKLWVISGFCFWIGPMTVSVLHMLCVYWNTDKAFGGFSYIPAFMLGQVIVGMSLITASIPTFKTFIQPFEKKLVPYERHVNRLDAHQSKDVTENGKRLILKPRDSVIPRDSLLPSCSKDCESDTTEQGAANMILGDTIIPTCDEDEIARADSIRSWSSKRKTTR